MAEEVSEIRELWVIEANARGRTFYERRGWRAEGKARVVDGAREVRYRRIRTAD